MIQTIARIQPKATSMVLWFQVVIENICGKFTKYMVVGE